MRSPERGFGPTLATEHFNDKHDVEVGRETVRQWMIAAKPNRSRWRKFTHGGHSGAGLAIWCNGKPNIHAWLEGQRIDGADQ